MPRSLFILLALTLGIAPQTAANAQLPQVADSRLGLDMVQLQGGQKVYGFILAELEDHGFQVAVERAWLQKTHPQLFDELQATERQQLERAREQLETRINDWITERTDPQDAVLHRFLESESSRIQDGTVEEQMQSLFIVLTLKRSDFSDVKLQPSGRRQIAGLAYQFNLDDVVTTPAKVLLRKLEQQGIDPQAEIVDLTRQVPAWQVHSDRQWSAKKALVEYQLREALEYQGTANRLFRKTADGVDMGELVGSMLGGGGLDAVGRLGAELGLPEFKQFSSSAKSDLWSRVVREAEADGLGGVLVTRLEQSLVLPRVTVHATFLAREKPESWFVAFNASSTEDANAQSAARVQEMKEDPQVKTVLNMLEQLGLAAGNRLDQALLQGVATERALGKARGDFNLFLARNIQVLDGLPVQISLPSVGGAAP